MNIDDPLTVSALHAMLREEYGGCARRSPCGEMVLVDLPGASYRVVARLSGRCAVRVGRKVIDGVDWSAPGIARFLLTEHAQLRFGRFGLLGEDLVVEHSLFAEEVTAANLGRIVRFLHEAAEAAERALEHSALLQVPEPLDDDETF